MENLPRMIILDLRRKSAIGLKNCDDDRQAFYWKEDSSGRKHNLKRHRYLTDFGEKLMGAFPTKLFKQTKIKYSFDEQTC